MDPECRLAPGEYATITTKGLVLPNGDLFPSNTRCEFAPGSGWRLHYTDEFYEKTSGGPMEPESVVIPPEHHVPVVETTPLAAPPGEDADLTQVLGAAAYLQDNPWAPLVMIVLAAIAVLGGRKAWTFYGEKSARAHELELKKLEIQEKQAGLQGAQPPPCALKQTENEARFAALEGRLSSMEKKNSLFGDFDPEEVQDLVKGLEKRLKKVERSAKQDSES